MTSRACVTLFVGQLMAESRFSEFFQSYGVYIVLEYRGEVTFNGRFNGHTVSVSCETTIH